MRNPVVCLLLCALCGSAFAQPAPSGAPAPDPAAVSRAIAVLQQQRNKAMDDAAQAEVSFAKAQADLMAAEKEIADLKAKIESNKKDAVPNPDQH